MGYVPNYNRFSNIIYYSYYFGRKILPSFHRMYGFCFSYLLCLKNNRECKTHGPASVSLGKKKKTERVKEK